jgi:hypothetical protein
MEIGLDIIGPVINSPGDKIRGTYKFAFMKRM